MKQDYYQSQSEIAECHVCGELKSCNLYVACYPESQTGYVDEYAICGDCERNI